MTDVTQTKRPERWHLGDAVVARLIDGACSGECCRLMTLSATPEQVAIFAANHRYVQRLWGSHRLQGGTAADFNPGLRTSPDAVYVERHWVPVRLSFYDGVEGTRFNGKRGPKPQQQYRCRQWDGNTRMCGDYEKRPGVCRSHGIRYQCKRADCTLFAHAVTLEHLRWEDEGGPQHPLAVLADETPQREGTR